jgi:MFS family permease
MISAWANTTFRALRNPNYRTLWIGTTISFLAFMMSSIVQSVVAFDLTGKNGAVGLVALGMGVATIFVSPFGGVIADRVSKRKLLLIGQTVIGINFLVVGLLIVTDQITIIFLVASTFVLGTVFSFIAPARQAWIGELVGTEELPNAVALQQLGMTATRIGGPFIAAALIALPFSGTGGAYLFMSGLFAVVVATLAQLPATKSRAKGTGPSMLGDLKLGVGHVKDRPRLLLLSLSFIGVVIGGFSYQVILPGFLENELGRDSDDMGLFLGVGAVSGLIVTLAVAGISGSRHAWRIMQIGGLLLGVSLMLTAVSGNMVQALGAMLLVGAGSSAFQLLNNALVMQESDPAYFGRVMSLTMLAWGMNGLVGLPFGLLADAAGERWTLMLMGAIVCGVVISSAVAYSMIGRRPPTATAPIEAPAGGR